MTDLERLRNLIGDSHKATVVKFIGDGVTLQWQLGRKRIKTGSVVLTVAGGITVSSVNYSTGLMTLSGAVTADALFSVSFEYSAFTDEELTDYLTGGSVKPAALECLQVLMADAARQYDYSTGIEEFKPSQVFDHLQKLQKSLRDQDLGLSASGGAMVKSRTSDYGDLDNLYDESPKVYQDVYIG